MSIFSRFLRSSPPADRYPAQMASYPVSNISRRHTSYNRHGPDIGVVLPEFNFDNVPYLSREIAADRAASEISLRSEYTNLDMDTNRYPRLTRTPSGSSNVARSSPKEGQQYQEKQQAGSIRDPAEARLAPLLAVGGQAIRWDVRRPPGYGNKRPTDNLSAPAMSTLSRYMCIISHDFPWTVAISSNDDRPLTVLDILEALYQSLNKEVRRSEWALATDVQRYLMLKANKARRRATSAMGIRRVDWLGTRWIFKGLEKDDELARDRLMPGDCPSDVWVVRFGSIGHSNILG